MDEDLITILYYETNDMAQMRAFLLSRGHTNEQVDDFKSCLITLQRNGFDLRGPA
jgi:hypothetical protein